MAANQKIRQTMPDPWSDTDIILLKRIAAGTMMFLKILSNTPMMEI
jgi:hypothetical protein